MDESNIEALLADGIAAAKAGKRDEARKLFFDIVALDPQCFEVWLWLGGIADDPTESVAYLSHALEMNPDSIRAQKGMAWAQERLAQAENGAPTEGMLERAATEARMAASQPLAESPQAASTAVGEAPSGSQEVKNEEKASAAPIAARVIAEPASSAEVRLAEVPPEPAKPEEAPAAVQESTGEPNGATAQAGEPVSAAPPTAPGMDLSSWAKMLTPESLLAEETDEETDDGISLLDEVASLGLDLGAEEASAGDPDLNWDTILARLKAMEQGSPATAEASARPEEAPADLPVVQLAPTAAPPEATHPEASLSSTSQAPVAEEAPAVPQFDLQPPAVAAAEPIATPDLSAIDLFGEPAPAQEAEDTDTADSWIDRIDVQQTGPLSAVHANVVELIEKGRRELEAGDLSEAIKTFTEALQNNPNSVEGREQLGVALYQAGRDEDAAREFRAIIGMKQDHAEARANLGFILAEQRKFDEAVDAFSGAIKYDPSLVEAHLGLAEIYQNQNRLPEAISEWKAASALRPDLIEVQKFLGDAFISQGRIEEATLAFRIILERDPNNAYAHQRIGEILVRLDRLADAAEEFRKALALDDSCAEAHYGLGVCLAELGQHSLAAAQLERALALRPDYPEAKASLEALPKSDNGSNQPNQNQRHGDSEEDKKHRGLFRWGRK